MKSLSKSVYDHQRKVSVDRNEEFKKKRLATHDVDVGFICDHGCTYCSTPSILCKNPSFKDTGKTAAQLLAAGCAVIDTDTPNRVPGSVKNLTSDDIVMMCPKTDGWSPACQKYNLGRDVLRAILNHNPDCKVRVLTKNAALAKDLAGLVQYKHRIMASLSLTAPRSKSHLAQIMEPNASTIAERLDALKAIKELGFKVYGMCCPAVPGLLTSEEDLEELLKELLQLEPETIWLEAVNPRGAGLKNTEAAFREAGETGIADQVKAIRNGKAHDDYVVEFVKTANKVGKKLGCDGKFKFLVYNDASDRLKAYDNVIYLGKVKAVQRPTIPVEVPERTFEYLDVNSIAVDPEVAERSTPKKIALAFLESIKTHGVLQPILVRRDGQEVKLVAGAKRLSGAKEAGLEKIPAIFMEDESSPEVSLKENLLRQGLCPMDKAEALHRLNKENKHRQENLAKMLGLSRSLVTELVGIGGLPKDIRDACRANPKTYPIRELKQLTKLKDEAQLREAFSQIGERPESAKQPKMVSGKVAVAVKTLSTLLDEFKASSPSPEIVSALEDAFRNLAADLIGIVEYGWEDVALDNEGVDASTKAHDQPQPDEDEEPFADVLKKPSRERSLADFVPDFAK